MKITYEDNRFIAISSYAEKDMLKSAGFWWNPDMKYWWTNEPVKALKLKAYADESAIQALNEIESEIKLSKAETSSIDYPRPENKDYYPFQKAGIQYALNKDNVLIGDEMGLGKTIQAIGVINTDKNLNNILIICPASLRLNWRNELRTWLMRNLTVEIIKKGEGQFPSTNIVVVNYDILKNFHQELREKVWDMLILDEVHYLKNPKTQRTIEVFGFKSEKKNIDISPIEARKRIYLTGTPIPNRPIELWHIINSMRTSFKISWKYFVKRYCNGGEGRCGWEVNGASNLDELQDKLRSTIMIRRLKENVLKELPEKRRQTIVLSNGCDELIQKERRLFSEFQKARDSLKMMKEDNSFSDLTQNLHGSIKAYFQEIAKLRHEIALEKIPYIMEHLENLDVDEKVVIFSHHKDVLNAVYEEYKEQSVLLTGGTSLKNRQEAIDRFQNDKNCKFFIGSLKAAGVGITLTASSHVIFCELDWTPAVMIQAEDRLHRIGQKNSILIQYLVFENSIDSMMADKLSQKQKVINEALDKERKEIDVVKKEEKIENLNEEEIEKIHKSLKYLAGHCDGAISKDGHGFNKFDSEFGKRLADVQQLTQKQASIGKRLCHKYRKQLGGFNDVKKKNL